jgi:hypothetical protein
MRFGSITGSTLALALAACSSGGSDPGLGQAPPPPPPDPTFACVGPVPAHALLCAGSDAGLTADTPRVLVGATCTGAPCAFVCRPGNRLKTISNDVSPDAAGGITAAPEAARAWQESKDWAAGLASGSCGLADGSRAGDWRLPGELELIAMAEALAVTRRDALPDPFVRVQDVSYWSSDSPCTTQAIAVPLVGDVVPEQPQKDLLRAAWPVR